MSRDFEKIFGKKSCLVRRLEKKAEKRYNSDEMLKELVTEKIDAKKGGRVFAVDIGNSSIVAAAFEGEKIVKKWRLRTDVNRSASQYFDDFQTFFAEDGFCADGWNDAILSAVVPCLLPTYKEVFSRICRRPPKVLERKAFGYLPVSVSPDFEREIGTDLVANATEAFCSQKGASIVVDFGTALTFTSVDEKGKIAGVAIAPGLNTSILALRDNTALLPSIRLAAPKSALGRDTTGAIQAGIVFGFKGLVEAIVERTKNDLRKSCDAKGGISVVATGGLCEAIQFDGGFFSQIDGDLTVKGLRRIFSAIPDNFS